MNAKHLKKHFQDLLKTHPEDQDGVLAIVCRELEEHHVEAARWMEHRFGMAVDAPNLLQVIRHWDEGKKVESILPTKTAPAFEHHGQVKPHRFQPEWLVDYFRVNAAS